MFGAVYAASIFGMSFERILVFGIAMNLSAAAGCFAVAAVEARMGSRHAIILALTGIAGLGIPLLTTNSESWFWVLALAIAFLFGAPEAASRTLMVQLAPPEDRLACFGLFVLTGRVTGFLGPAVVAGVTAATESQRLGVATTLAFIAKGAAILASGTRGFARPGADHGSGAPPGRRIGSNQGFGSISSDRDGRSGRVLLYTNPLASFRTAGEAARRPSPA